MALILDGTTGASAVQDSSVTDGKLSLTANSEQIKTALNASNGAPIYACRAWVNFNGTGTVAIRASGNVSSITDNGTGDYTVNFTAAMPDANYSFLGGVGRASSKDRAIDFYSLATTSVKVETLNINDETARDVEFVSVSIFR